MANFLSVYITTICITLLTSGVMSAQNQEWKWVTDTENWDVYTRKSAGSNLKEVRIKGTMNASLKSIVTALNDVDKYPQWIYKCEKSYQFNVIDKDKYHYYVRTSLPSPFYDRDMVVHTNQWYEHKTWNSETLADPFEIPKNKRVVRIERYRTRWKVKAISSDRVEFDYIISLDPGGFLPAWLLNLAITIGPKNTIISLEKRSKEIMNIQKIIK